MGRYVADKRPPAVWAARGSTSYLARGQTVMTKGGQAVEAGG